jgi:hypothetical protein
LAKASGLKPAARGGYVARKWIPPDVRETYGALHGKGPPQHEAWFNSGPVNLPQAKALHREWLNLIESRITNIRAERRGEGRSLAPQQARALAAEWYAWFVKHMEANGWRKDAWHAYRDRMWEGLYSVAEGFGDPFDHANASHVRPVIADEGKTAQFLAAKGLPLDPSSRDLFLDYVARDFFAALDLLTRRAEGDFGRDAYPDRFPKPGRAVDPSLTAWSLFEKWIAKEKPATSTIVRWRAVFRKLQADFPDTGAAALLPD